MTTHRGVPSSAAQSHLADPNLSLPRQHRQERHGFPFGETESAGDLRQCHRLVSRQAFEDLLVDCPPVARSAWCAFAIPTCSTMACLLARLRVATPLLIPAADRQRRRPSTPKLGLEAAPTTADRSGRVKHGAALHGRRPPEARESTLLELHLRLAAAVGAPEVAPSDRAAEEHDEGEQEQQRPTQAIRDVPDRSRDDVRIQASKRPIHGSTSCAPLGEILSASGILRFMPRVPPPARTRLQEPVGGRIGDGLQAAVHAELAQDVLHVIADGGRAHVQPLGDGLAVTSGSDEPEDLELATGELDGGLRAGRGRGQSLLDQVEQLLRGGHVPEEVDREGPLLLR